MKLTPPLEPSTSLRLSGPQDARKLWKVGDLVTAVATKRRSPRELTLRIGKSEYTGYARTPVPIGQPMLMRVAQTGQQPVLELVQAVTSGRHNPAASTALPELLDSLMRLSTSSADGQASRQVLAAAMRLLSILPESAKLAGATELRQLVGDSGNFLEAKLLQALSGGAHGHFGGDWKALLLGLRQTLRRLLPRQTSVRPSSQRALASFAAVDTSRSLLQLLDEALINIELNQLSSRGTDDPSQQVWVVELPVKGSKGEPGLIHFRIRRDSSASAEAGESNWSITLQMDVTPLGPLRINLSLHGERVSVHICADQHEAAELLRRNLDQLGHRLTQRDLDVGELTGTAAQGPAPSRPPTSVSLLA